MPDPRRKSRLALALTTTRTASPAAAALPAEVGRLETKAYG